MSNPIHPFDFNKIWSQEYLVPNGLPTSREWSRLKYTVERQALGFFHDEQNLGDMTLRRLYFGLGPLAPFLNESMVDELTGGGDTELHSHPGSCIVTITASEAISAVKVVTSQGTLANPNDPDVFEILGFSRFSAGMGESLQVITDGVVENNTWTLSDGIVWLAANGEITQVAPVTDYDIVIGVAVSPTELLLRIGESIELE